MMVAFWKIRVLMGKCTIDDVPEKYREAVREALEPSDWRAYDVDN